jgi:LmbE family N-acetylglucosaminyl deacetylase
MKVSVFYPVFLLFHFVLFGLRAQTPGDLLLKMKKLSTCTRVLYIAAHPDDENTRLISYLENSRYCQTAYLSLTRGDGGQNLIGNEQSEELGLIRTQELLAARREDGGEQFFTRAFDFGYSKNPEETFSIWNRREILADVVFVIRKFRPDIIITRFPTNGDGGHGHHTASAILAEEAFKAAGNPEQFPEQLKFVSAFQPKRLFWNNFARWRNPDADMSASMSLEINQFVSERGLSIGEIAANSRSCHRSQGFGSAPQYGSIMEYFDLLDGTPAKSDILEGIAGGWEKYKVTEKLNNLCNQVIQAFNPQNPANSIPALLEIYEQLNKAEFFPEKQDKIQLISEIITGCAGLHMQLNANKVSFIPGQEAEITFQAVCRNSCDNLNVDSLFLNGRLVLSQSNKLLTRQLLEKKFNFLIPENIGYTNPFWLENEHSKGSFKVSDASEIANPDVSPAITGRVVLSYGNQRLSLVIPVLHRMVDPSRGELKLPITIQPEIQAKLNDEVLALAGNDVRELIVEISGPGSAGGKVYPELPPSVFTCEPAFYELNDEQPFRILKFKVGISPNRMFKPDSAYTVNIIYERDGKKELLQSVRKISYEHIPDQTWIKPASVKVLHLNMKREVKSVAYVEGAGDKVAQCLSNAGYSVTILNKEEIRAENLSKYDAVVMGIRAFNTRSDIPVIMSELLKYTEQGGTLVVQYNTKNWISDVTLDPGPYTLSISRDRRKCSC